MFVLFCLLTPGVLLQLGRSLMQQACDHGYFQRDPCCCLVQRNSLGEKMVDANPKRSTKFSNEKTLVV